MSATNDLIKRCFHDRNRGLSFGLITRKRGTAMLAACLAIFFVVLLLACSSPSEEEAKVTGVSVSSTDASFIKLNKTITLSVEIRGTGNSDKSVTWKSS